MTTIAEMWLDEGIEKGIEKGAQRTKLEIAERLLRRETDWRTIEDLTGLDEAAFDALKQRAAQS